MQFSIQQMMVAVFAFAIALLLRDWFTPPGKIAITLLVYLTAISVLAPCKAPLSQILAVAYLCVLADFAWSALDNFMIVSPSPIPVNYWSMTAKSTCELRSLCLIWVPLLIVGAGITKLRSSRTISPSRWESWPLIIGTMSLLFFNLGVYLLWFMYSWTFQRYLFQQD